MPTRKSKQARKGFSRPVVVDAALEMINRVGEESFGIRPLAAELGIDPMTVLHHVGSRDRLVREACDLLISRLPLGERRSDWLGELRAVAAAFRALALRYPRAFPLLLRFAATGPADYAQGERVYSALLEAGFGKRQAAHLGISFYAIVIGLSAAEVGGLLHPASDEEIVEMNQLPAGQFPATIRLKPTFRTLSAEAVINQGLDAFFAGLKALTPGSSRAVVRPD